MGALAGPVPAEEKSRSGDVAVLQRDCCAGASAFVRRAGDCEEMLAMGRGFERDVEVDGGADFCAGGDRGGEAGRGDPVRSGTGS